jgi:hypothetical protein
VEQSIYAVLVGLASEVPVGIAVYHNTIPKHLQTLVGGESAITIADTRQLDYGKLGGVYNLMFTRHERRSWRAPYKLWVDAKAQLKR